MIPPIFHSAYLDGPFERCLGCERELLDPPLHYVLQKYFVAGEAVFEMALCFDCTENLRQEISRQSQQAIAQFLTERFGNPDPPPAAGTASDSNVPPSTMDGLEAIETCILCEQPRDACHRYAIGGAFLGNVILVRRRMGPAVGFPWMVCDRCNRDLNARLSQKTRDAWDRFVDEHFDGPPGIEVDSPDARPVLL